AHHRARADLLVAEHAKELAEAVEPLPQHAVDRLERAVARCNARAARRDDDLNLGAGQLTADRIAQLLGVVPHERASDDAMPGGGQELDDRPAASIVFFRARVADGHDITL